MCADSHFVQEIIMLGRGLLERWLNVCKWPKKESENLPEEKQQNKQHSNHRPHLASHLGEPRCLGSHRYAVSVAVFRHLTGWGGVYRIVYMYILGCLLLLLAMQWRE